jgi:hypothetical protein
MLINIYRSFVYATSKITTMTSFPDLIGESRKHWIVRSSQTMANCLIPLSLCIVVLILCVSSPAYSSSDWKITLKVSGKGTYDYCIAGVKDGASDGRDNAWDVPSPPGSPNAAYISTYFPHTEWGGVFDRFRRDIKSPDLPKEWTFEVVSNISGELTISWPDLKNAIPDKDAVLVEINEAGDEINMRINMHTSTSFVFLNDGFPRKFKVMISQGISVPEPPVPEPPVPEPPEGLEGKLKGKTVLLYWKSNNEPDLAGYNVYRVIIGR